MSKRSYNKGLRVMFAPLSIMALLSPAYAQDSYQGYTGYSEPDAPVYAEPEPEAAPEAAPSRGKRGGGRHVDIAPYLEVDQTVLANLTGDTDVLTYTTVAAGVDASIANRRAEAQISLRYEHRFYYEQDGLGDEDVVSGIARGSVQVVPGLLSLEAGALATRTSVDDRSGVPSNLVGQNDNVTQVYSGYIGPTLATNVGDVSVSAGYRLGYTKVEESDVVLAPGEPARDIFDDSVSQSASVSVGQQPGALPFGWSVSGGWDREDAGELDQRLEAMSARADVTVPVTPTVALVGGVGYEDIEITERDALRDADGDPVVGGDGRLVTDPASPRLLAYEESGVIWDAGVLWRPSRRTSLEARVGRRYGSTTYYGSASYQPSERTALNVSVYDTVSGYGGRLNDGLAGLSTQFNSNRNPLSGELNGCVFSTSSPLCFNDVLQSASSSSFRSRGVTAALSTQLGSWNTGFGVGYNRQRFFAATGGALAIANGVIDENYFANLYLGRQLDESSSFDANVYANYLQSTLGDSGDILGLGANAAYYRNFTSRLAASAAVGVDSIDQQGFEADVIASALLGLRYSF